MKYFSVPSDYDKKKIEAYEEYNSLNPFAKVKETFGESSHINLCSTENRSKTLPDLDNKEFEQYIRFSKDRNIEFNYNLDISCWEEKDFTGKGYKLLKDFVNNLASLGISTVTVALPFLIDIINSMDIGLRVKVAAQCEVNSPYKAKLFKELGASGVVVDEMITRDFGKLSSIVGNFGEGVEIVINSVCFNECLKNLPGNHNAHCLKDSTKIGDQDFHYLNCLLEKGSDTARLLKMNWIRPEDLKFYRKIGIHHYRIQGRELVSRGNILKTLKHYTEEHFEGNLLKLLTLFSIPDDKGYINNKSLNGFLDKFAENRDFCKAECEECGHCDNFARKSNTADREEVAAG